MALIYLLLALVVAGSCLVEYWGARWLSGWPESKQNRIAIALVAICALGLAVFRTNLVATDCLVLVGALVAGVLLSRMVGSVGTLTIMLMVAAGVDLISSYAGPSRWLVEHSQHSHGATELQFLTVSLRLRRTLVHVIGVSDLMFFTAVVCTVRRQGWTERSALFVPMAGLLAALAVGLVAGFTPALPFLAGAVVANAYWMNTVWPAPCRG